MALRQKMNNMYDNLSGKDAKIVGGSNIKNGADRIVNNTSIQVKYCDSGSKCINECFDNNDSFRYINTDGTPMQIEVPLDKYDDAVRIDGRQDKERKNTWS